ncbi:MaoC family dehydratase [Paenibacillus sp. MMS20-IR301]|uniref:MaoC family dehydratase n=1 Tax=Paenibacillus sp. MMS20-IR301 TaxID=2895946 RepID=UPI0028E1AD9A|nr:MaoC family dehydratase [Paenibacillus sp. MMS20-IR301]WNS44052.1 MaoC family dehydratase [Paenibacillus sp. MMS20-IR301]
MKYHEFSIGQVFKTKSLRITHENIKSFAAEYDPQYMHLDEEKAGQGRFNGIIASGIQTLAVSFKLWVETGSYGEDVIAGTAMNHIKFIKPVFPGDELHCVIEVIGLSSKKNETGLVTVSLSTFNQADEKVFAGELTVLVNKQQQV